MNFNKIVRTGSFEGDRKISTLSEKKNICKKSEKIFSKSEAAAVNIRQTFLHLSLLFSSTLSFFLSLAEILSIQLFCFYLDFLQEVQSFIAYFIETKR